MEEESVFKIAVTQSRVRKLLETNGWVLQGKDEEMDCFREEKTGRRLCIEDISENFPVTFLMGDIHLAEFIDITRKLTPETKLLEVESSWEGKPTTIVVAMTEEQVSDMFGKGTKMRRLSGRHTAPQA